LGLLLGAILSAPREARARSGDHTLETIGVSIAVGTVLGASTLPFYDQPGTHLLNLVYGAAAGAVVGVGVVVSQEISGGSSNDQAGLDPAQKPVRQAAPLAQAKMPEPAFGTLKRPVSATQFWTPLVSLNW
jgi:hypothetical protein